MGNVLDKKYNKLKDFILSLESVIVAFSGGTDSTLLLKVCKDVLGKESVLAVTAVSPSRMKKEIEEAKVLSEEIGIEHQLIDSLEFENSKYIKNDLDRCYVCRKDLNEVLYKLKKDKEKYKHILNGTNIDDLEQFRPGVNADKEDGVVYPFVEVGLNKEEIRGISQRINLRTWDKASKPCLATRIPVKDKITVEKVKKIEKCEELLYNMGFEKSRVRYLNDTARIEIPVEEFSFIIQKERLDKIVKKFKEIGFKFISLDLEGYSPGKMNGTTIHYDSIRN